MDRALAKKEAQELYKAGEKKIGTDESAFLKIMALRHFYQLRATFEEYARVRYVTTENTQCILYILYITLYNMWLIRVLDIDGGLVTEIVLERLKGHHQCYANQVMRFIAPQLTFKGYLPFG